MWERIGLLVLACGLGAGEVGAAGRQPLRVVATVGMVADVVRQVGGDQVAVQTLIGAGVDPHLYKPTRSDVAALLSAEMVFYSSLLLEGRMGDVLHKIGAGGKPVVAVTEAIDPGYLLSYPGRTGHHDPHVWMDVAAWRQTVAVVEHALAKARPEEADALAARAERYRAELEVLHAYVRAVVASIPEERRVLVTAHDAFAYFGRAYGIEVRGIQGISTESEAGLDDINRLIDTMVQRAVPAVFVETSVSEKNVRALVEGAAARRHQLSIGGVLYSDAMGPAGTYEGTYLGMLDHNATTIARALGGQVPERGRLGLLKGAP